MACGSPRWPRAAAGGSAPPKEAQEGEADQAAGQTERGRHTLDGEAQTNALFDSEIVQRMRPAFYSGVFAPAVARALAEGKGHESIRDSIRKTWKPAR